MPIVFYHGKRPWSWETSFKEGHAGKYFFDIPVFFRKNMLNYNLIVFDTNDPKVQSFFKDRRIKTRGAFKVLQRIWSLKETVPELLELVASFVSGLSEGERRDWILGLFDYLQQAGGISAHLLKKVENQAIDLGLLKKGGGMNFKDEIKKEAQLQGWQEGREQGLQEGLQSGLQEGLQSGREQVVLNMLKEKINVSVISKVTGFSEKAIKKLQNG